LSLENGELGLLATDAMRARRHPWAVVALWAWEAALALLVAVPVANLVADTVGNGPAGDRTLWEPGGLVLLEALQRHAPALDAVTAMAAGVLLLAAVAGLVPAASTLTVLAYATREGRPPGAVPTLTEGARLFPPMALLFAFATVTQALVLGFGAAAGSVLEAWTHDSLGEARAQQVQGLVLLLALAAVSVVGVAHDLARAALVRFKVGGGRALMLGVRTLRLFPVPLWWSWAWRAASSMAPVFVAAWVTTRLGGRPGRALFVVFALHQLVVAARVALRTSWMARSLRAVDVTLRREG
jgi:hypothetical protein